MKEIVEFLSKNRTGAFATVGDGKPHVRPWGFMFEQDGRFYFCTANNKEVFRHLVETPYAAFTSTSPEMVTVRLSGKVAFTDDIALKQKAIDSYPGLAGIYGSGDNPIFEMFYIEHGEATLSDFSGQPPRCFTF